MKNPLSIIGILIGVVSTVIGGAAAAQPGSFMIVNFGSGLCVNADRTVVQLWDCDLQARSMRWQFFTLVPDRFFKLISAVGSRCLDVAEGSLQPGAKIQIYRCTQSNTNTAQIWETRAIPGN